MWFGHYDTGGCLSCADIMTLEAVSAVRTLLHWRLFQLCGHYDTGDCLSCVEIMTLEAVSAVQTLWHWRLSQLCGHYDTGGCLSCVVCNFLWSIVINHNSILVTGMCGWQWILAQVILWSWCNVDSRDFGMLGCSGGGGVFFFLN
jgi:hypothetical protein